MTIPRTRRGKGVDNESEAVIYQGANVSQLARLFGLDNRTVAAKLYELPPAGQRNGYDYWSIKDAASYLAEVRINLEDTNKLAEYIRKLNHSNLPKMLTKEFWAAMLAKQKYEENAGELWRTERVVEVVSDLVKTVRTPLILARDTVAAQSELTPRQQQVLNAVIDNILEELHEAVTKNFSEQNPQEEQVEDDSDL